MVPTIDAAPRRTDELYWFDAHLDLAYLAQTGRDMLRETADVGAGTAVTLPALRQGLIRRALATIFVQRRIAPGTSVEPVDGPWCYSDAAEAYQASAAQLEVYAQWQRAGHIRILSTTPTNLPARLSDPLETLVLLEGAAGVRSVEDLHEFVRRGVRVLALSWVDGTRWSGGDHSGTDITAEGRTLVEAADALGLVHDVSHLSEKAFWTMLDLGRNPKIASHSNCRALLPGAAHPQRHLSDQQIKALVKSGGRIGINLYSKFLVGTGRATIADVLRHIEHIAELTGRSDCMGLGSDMDGGFDAAMLPADLHHPQHLPRLAEALAERGFSDDDINGLAHRNWEKFFQLAPLA